MNERVLVVGNLAKDVINKSEFYGGSAAIIALGIKRLGVDVSILSVSATDNFSRYYLLYLQKNGVDTTLVEKSLEKLPVCEVVSNTNDDTSRKWTDNGSESSMNNLCEMKLPVSFGLVHITSAPRGLAEYVSSIEARISYEPGPRLNRDPNFLSIKAAKKSLLLFFNQEEYAVAQKSLKDLTTNKNNYPNLLAIITTLGESGSKIMTWNDTHTADVISVPPLNKVNMNIDFTGAGDNYKAGFLAAFINGRSLHECAQIGTEMAFACVTQIGGILPESKVKEIRSKYGL